MNKKTNFFCIDTDINGEKWLVYNKNQCSNFDEQEKLIKVSSICVIRVSKYISIELYNGAVFNFTRNTGDTQNIKNLLFNNSEKDGPYR